jgi:hypothetical protein
MFYISLNIKGLILKIYLNSFIQASKLTAHSFVKDDFRLKQEVIYLKTKSHCTGSGFREKKLGKGV